MECDKVGWRVRSQVVRGAPIPLRQDALCRCGWCSPPPDAVIQMSLTPATQHPHPGHLSDSVTPTAPQRPRLPDQAV